MERRRRGRWWSERAEHEGDEVGRRKRMKRVGRKKEWWGWCVWGVIVPANMKLKHVSC